MTSQRIALFTGRCWFQKLFGDKMKKVLDNSTKWLTLTNKDQFTPEYLKKTVLKPWQTAHKSPVYTEVLWLSRGSVLNRMSELTGKLQDYYQGNRRPDFANCFEDDERLEKLAYLADMFHQTNQLNKSLQGPGENVFGFK
jgi:hypothetical protein